MEISPVIHSNLAIPPGEYLEEVISELGMTKDELARRMNRPATKLSPIFKGNKSITPETALQLEKVVGVPAHIWTGLESDYRLTLARNKAAAEEKELKKEISLVSKFCYHELVKLGQVPDTRKPLERVQALHRFFGVTSLHHVLGSRRYQAAFRCGNSQKRSPEALAAWLRFGECQAQQQFCTPHDHRKLINSFSQLRQMTLLEPDDFQEALVSILSDNGIALVICPHFPKTRAHGATFWLNPQKAVLMITIRQKWADIFWFSLFHEIGHILLHGQKSVIIEDDAAGRLEKEADTFAANQLIPKEAFRKFLKKGRFYPDDIKAFASMVEIHPGIVVGRLQHEKILPHHWDNELRVRFSWKE
jgi:HTH-type transcriptional regulator / antitoxin HigA